jgi:hypothetical protein
MGHTFNALYQFMIDYRVFKGKAREGCMGSVRVKMTFCLHSLVNTGGFNGYPLSTFGHEMYR